MRITLVYPSVGRKKGKKYLKSWQMEPLAIAILAGLTPSDIEIRFYDDRLEDVNFDESTDLAALSVETYSAKRAYEIAREFRNRKVPVVMGGYHPTLLPNEAIQYADSLIVGNAEPVWTRVIEDLRSGKMQKIYEAGSSWNGHYSIPLRSIFSGKRYMNIALLETGRGCRFSCEFCSVTSFYGGQHERRSEADVVAEVEKLKDKLIFFVDDNIIGDISSAKKLFSALIPQRAKWISQCSLNVVKDDELLDLMAKSGCVGLLIGFESIVKGNLAQMQKTHNFDFGDYRYALKKLRQKGIVLYGAFVFGYDCDNESIVWQTVDFSKEEKIFMAAFNHLVPFPGTPLYERLLSENKLRTKQWWLDPAYQYGDICFQPKEFTPERLTQLCLEARSSFYGIGSILKRGMEFQANCRNLKQAGLYLMANFMLRREVMEKRSIKLGSTD